MRRLNNLYEDIYSFEGLYRAYLEARKGKRQRNEVLEFTSKLEENIIQLQNELMWKEYKVSPYRQFYIHEPKKRLIMALPFRDRVVQWSIYRTLNPYFDKQFIKDSYACRIGYGSHKSIIRLQYWLQQLDRQNKKVYILKMDIAKYFYRVDHDVLINILKRHIKDKDLLWLLETIIRCEHTNFGLNLENEGFTGKMIKYVGMPIGNLTSQMFANLYLNELDQFVKHELKAKYYLRYMDDSMILHHDKKFLWYAKSEIERFLDENLSLVMNDKTTIRTAKQGVDWVGYRVWPTHIKLRKSTAKRMKANLNHVKKLYSVGDIEFDRVNASVQSYMGILKHCNCYKLKKNLYSKLVFIKGRKERRKIK
jgi:RNA-directed DNA polymerase